RTGGSGPRVRRPAALARDRGRGGRERGSAGRDLVSGAADRFREAAAREGLAPKVRRFPEGTRTAEDAARAIGCDVAQIVKSLVFMAEDGPFLALTSGANRADPARLGVELGTKGVRRATADEVREATGYAIGGTPPFGHA